MNKFAAIFLLLFPIYACNTNYPVGMKVASDINLYPIRYSLVGPSNFLGLNDINFFGDRFSFSKPHASLQERQFSEFGGKFVIRKIGSAYYSERLPLFAPTRSMQTISNDIFHCGSTLANGRFLVVCRAKTTNTVLTSLFDPSTGVQWFEYFCAPSSVDVCKYELNGKNGVFSPQFIVDVERSGLVQVTD